MVPSYLLLKRLVETRLPEILEQESRNTDQVHLYDTGEYWTAFDRSAYFLKTAYPDLSTFVLMPQSGDGRMAVAVSVPVGQAETCQSLVVGKMDAQAYNRWHASEENKYKLYSKQ